MRRFLYIILVGLFLSSCQENDPTGQVIVSLPNAEITLEELRHEMRENQNLDRHTALAQLVDRKILVAAANDENLHLKDSFHLSSRKAREELLVQELTKHVSKTVPSRLEEEVWIEINRESWRYKDRMRFYLTRNDSNGARSVFWIDTAEYDEPLPDELMQAKPGDIVTLKDQDWTVHLRETLVANPETMFDANMEKFEADHISKNFRRIIAKVRNSGQVVYQDGYGPANTQN